MQTEQSTVNAGVGGKSGEGEGKGRSTEAKEKLACSGMVVHAHELSSLYASVKGTEAQFPWPLLIHMQRTRKRQFHIISPKTTSLKMKQGLHRGQNLCSLGQT